MPSADKTKLLEDTFNVLEVDPDGKKFDKGMGVAVRTARDSGIQFAVIMYRKFFYVWDLIRDKTWGNLPAEVSRIKAHSYLYEMDLILDVNVDIYPVNPGDKLTMCLATTLNLDGSAMPRGHVDTQREVYDRSVGVRSTLADDYEYVVFGKVFKYRDNSASGAVMADVFASFGGLLMQLTGEPKRLQSLDLDQNLYLLIRKRKDVV